MGHKKTVLITLQLQGDVSKSSLRWERCKGSPMGWATSMHTSKSHSTTRARRQHLSHLTVPFVLYPASNGSRHMVIMRREALLEIIWADAILLRQIAQNRVLRKTVAHFKQRAAQALKTANWSSHCLPDTTKHWTSQQLFTLHDKKSSIQLYQNWKSQCSCYLLNIPGVLHEILFFRIIFMILKQKK